MLWISFASIDAQTAAFYEVSIGKVCGVANERLPNLGAPSVSFCVDTQLFDCVQVNWLAIVFQVMYPVGMVFALYTMAASSLRHSLVSTRSRARLVFYDTLNHNVHAFPRWWARG